MAFGNLSCLFLWLAAAQAATVQRLQPTYQDYGELRIAVTADFSPVWSDAGSGAKRDVSFWHPKTQDPSFRPLGSVAVGSHTDINGKRATILVALNPSAPPKDKSKPALKEPSNWALVWTDKKSNAKKPGSVWRPICQSGYESIGDFGQAGHDKPAWDAWCVRSDIAKKGKYNEATIWDDAGSGAAQDAFIWQIIPGPTPPTGSEDVPLFSDAFRCINTKGQPPAEVSAFTISIKVPKNYTQFAAKLPGIEANKLPHKGDIYDEQKEAGLTLPLTAFFKNTAPEVLQYMKSPFATVERSVAWIAESVWENNAAGELEQREMIKYGFSSEKKESFEHSTGISMTASTGIGLADYSVSLNYQFTYKSTSSYKEFASKEEEKTFKVPGHYATVLFCKLIKVKVSHMDGLLISEGDNLATGEVHISGVPLK